MATLVHEDYLGGGGVRKRYARIEDLGVKSFSEPTFDNSLEYDRETKTYEDYLLDSAKFFSSARD